MALKHNIFTATMPEDAADMIAALDKASAEGFAIVATNSALWDDGKIYLTVIVGKAVTEPPPRRGISMGERSNPAGQRVDPNLPAL